MFKNIIQTSKSAFSMLELIFVIIILGIVSSIGAEVIANVYESYITQRAQYRASMKVETTLTQISNRLSSAIPGTVYRRNGTGGAAELVTSGTASTNYTVLQWVGKDTDSFTAIATALNRRPGWSGFCDLDASAGTAISTPGSNLDLASTVIGNLGGTLAGSRVYFSGYPNTPSLVTTGTAEGITLATVPARTVEHYKLAWTSYALSVEGGDLFLYHGFTPTPAVALAGTRTLLLQNVTNFKFFASGRTLRIKFCVREQIGDGFIPSCSERVVF